MIPDESAKLHREAVQAIRDATGTHRLKLRVDDEDTRRRICDSVEQIRQAMPGARDEDAQVILHGLCDACRAADTQPDMQPAAASGVGIVFVCRECQRQFEHVHAGERA